MYITKPATQMLGWRDLQQRKYCSQDSQLRGGKNKSQIDVWRLKGLGYLWDKTEAWESWGKVIWDKKKVR